MRTILVPYYGKSVAGSALDTALVVANTYASHIEGLFVRQLPPIVAGEGITLPGDYMTQLAEEGRQLARKAEEEFAAEMARRNIPVSGLGAASNSVTASWSETDGIESQVVGDYGRVFDLIVIGRHQASSAVDWRATCESALFDTGRPVLVAADQAPEAFATRIVIAWNGSTETARTLAMCTELLRRAASVVVLVVEGATVPGPGADEVMAHLLRNGVKATAKNVAADSRAAGRAILDETAELGADLLIKGAFTRSRLRQMIFGGPTSEILADATLPVLLAH